MYNEIWNIGVLRYNKYIGNQTHFQIQTFDGESLSARVSGIL